MRIFYTLAFLIFCSSLSAQDKGLLAGGPGIRPRQADQVMFGAKLAYFRYMAPRQLYGIKTALNTDGIGASKYAIRITIINLDLVRRWSFIKRPKIQLWLDTGISMLENLEKRQNWLFALGYSSGGPIRDPNDPWHIEREFSPGLALASGIDFGLGQRFFLGLELAGNMYHSKSDERVYSNLNPSITLTFPILKFQKEAHHRRD